MPHGRYAWTTVANLLIIESPAGVGYSYCVREADLNPRVGAV